MPPGILLGLLVLVAVTWLVWQWFKSSSRQSAAHTETRQVPSVATPRLPDPQAEASHPEALRPAITTTGPVEATVTYTKVDGSTSVRSLTIFSQNLERGVSHSLNCRQQGERITKTFLLSGIGRIQLGTGSGSDGSPLVLSTAAEILDWVERCIPERSQRPKRAASSLPPPPPPPPLSSASESKSVPVSVAAVQVAQAPALPELLPGGARGFAVLDLETTGTGRSCRIVEIALVRLDPKGRITEEWETLVHPGQSIPNAYVHGIDNELVSDAPSFEKIAGTLAAKLHQHVLVAHNLHSFDGPILAAHFAEVDGIRLNLGVGIDTMPTPRMKLAELCARHGVELSADAAHTALGDTRALTSALQAGMTHLKPASEAVMVEHNGRLSDSSLPLTRARARITSEARSPGRQSDRPVITATKGGWQSERLTLNAGLMFLTSGPKSLSADTEIKRATAYAIKMGLKYHKSNAIPKRNPPAFLLSTSLDLQNQKMREARERQIPVVLSRDLMKSQNGGTVQAFRYGINGHGS